MRAALSPSDIMLVPGSSRGELYGARTFGFCSPPHPQSARQGLAGTEERRESGRLGEPRQLVCLHLQGVVCKSLRFEFICYIALDHGMCVIYSITCNNNLTRTHQIPQIRLPPPSVRIQNPHTSTSKATAQVHGHHLYSLGHCQSLCFPLKRLWRGDPMASGGRVYRKL